MTKWIAFISLSLLFSPITSRACNPLGMEEPGYVTMTRRGVQVSVHRVSKRLLTVNTRLYREASLFGYLP